MVVLGICKRVESDLSDLAEDWKPWPHLSRNILANLRTVL
jgi:hypothetical protein